MSRYEAAACATSLPPAVSDVGCCAIPLLWRRWCWVFLSSRQLAILNFGFASAMCALCLNPNIF
jgi:hypothetical protein